MKKHMAGRTLSLALGAAALVATPFAAKAAVPVHTWTGGGDGTTWLSDDNWSGGAPNATTEQAKFSGECGTVTSAEDITLAQFILDASASVTLSFGGAALNVKPSLSSLKPENPSETVKLGGGSSLTLDNVHAAFISKGQTYNKALGIGKGAVITVDNGSIVDNGAGPYSDGGTIVVKGGSTWNNTAQITGGEFKNSLLKATGSGSKFSVTSGMIGSDVRYESEDGGLLEFPNGSFSKQNHVVLYSSGEGSKTKVSITKNAKAGPNTNGSQLIAVDSGYVEVSPLQYANGQGGFVSGLDNNGVLIAATNGTVNFGANANVATYFGTGTSDPVTLLGNPTLRMVGEDAVVKSSSDLTIGQSTADVEQYPIVEFVLGENGFTSAPLTSSKKLTIQSNVKLVVDASALLPQEDGSLAPVVLAQPSGTLTVADAVLTNADITAPEGWSGVLSVEGKQLILSFLPAGVAIVPTVPSKVYTGETLVAEPVGGLGWEIVVNDGGTDVGDYTVTLEFAEGYVQWEDGSTNPTNLTFTITQAANEWTVEPSISKATWLTTDEPGVLTAGETLFGTLTATITTDGGDPEEFDGTLPEYAGRYVITYEVEESDNWTNPETLTKIVEFEIVADDVVPPFTVTVDEIGSAQKDGQVDATISYTVSCEVESSKTVDLYALYALEGADTTNDYKFAEGVALDAKGLGEISDLMPGANYYVSVYGKGGETVSPTTEVQKVTVAGPATGLRAAATFTNDPKKFIITGSVTPGLGATTVYLRWSLNSDALDNLKTIRFEFGEEGTFVREIDYENLSDTLTWDVAVSNSFETVTYGPQSWNDAQDVQTTTRTDTKAVTYTWIGATNDQWDAFANWSPDSSDCYGFPNSSEFASAKFDDKAGESPLNVKLGVDAAVKAFTTSSKAPAMTIDLEGHTFSCNQTGSAYGSGVGWQRWLFDHNSVNGPLTFKNGALVSINAQSELLLRSNTHLVFDGIDFSTSVPADIAAFYQNGNTEFDFLNGTKIGNSSKYTSILGGNGCSMVIDNSTVYAYPKFSRAADKGSTLVVRNGGKLITNDAAWSYEGKNVTLRVEGSGSSATFRQSLYANNSFTGQGWTLAAVDGGSISMASIVKTFAPLESASSYDIKTCLAVSNGTFEVTNNSFNFGIHQSDADCVSPTISLAGSNPVFKTAKEFTFGSDAELTNPPVLELMPAPGGFASGAIRTANKDHAITIGSNVVVRVNVADLKAKGANRASMVVAQVPAGGTLNVDLEQLAANTTVTEEGWRVSYQLINDGTALKAKVSAGGFVVIVK